MPFNLKYKYILKFRCTECNHSSFIRRLYVKCWHKLASTHQCIELCGTHDQYLTDDCSKSVPLRIIRAMCYFVFFCLRFFFLFNQYHRPWKKININQSTVQCANCVWCTIIKDSFFLLNVTFIMKNKHTLTNCGQHLDRCLSFKLKNSFWPTVYFQSQQVL